MLPCAPRVTSRGVAANLTVRSELARVAAEAGLPMVCPPLRLCMDNGVMVAWTGMQRLRLGLAERPLSADADESTLRLFTEVRPKWPLGPRDPRSSTLQQQLSKRKQSFKEPSQSLGPQPALLPPTTGPDTNRDDMAVDEAAEEAAEAAKRQCTSVWNPQ